MENRSEAVPLWRHSSVICPDPVIFFFTKVVQNSPLAIQYFIAIRTEVRRPFQKNSWWGIASPPPPCTGERDDEFHRLKLSPDESKLSQLNSSHHLANTNVKWQRTIAILSTPSNNIDRGREETCFRTQMFVRKIITCGAPVPSLGALPQHLGKATVLTFRNIFIQKVYVSSE